MRTTRAIRVGGAPVHFAAPREAEAAGIQTLYQEVNLCANLSVAENIFAGRQPMRRGAIDWNTIHARSRAALAELDLALDVTRSLDAYPIAVQQMVAIARAVSVDARVLILDEPTSSLDDGEVARLFDVLRRLKASGIAILFVTHFLEQTYAVSDRITVMRNGEREGEYLARDLPVDVLVAKMTGRERMSDTLQAGAAAVERTAGEADPFLSMQQVGRRGMMARSTSTCGPARSSDWPGCSARGAPKPRSWRSPRSAPTPARSRSTARARGSRRRTTRSATASRIARRIARRRASSPHCRSARTSFSRCRRGAAGGG